MTVTKAATTRTPNGDNERSAAARAMPIMTPQEPNTMSFLFTNEPARLGSEALDRPQSERRAVNKSANIAAVVGA